MPSRTFTDAQLRKWAQYDGNTAGKLAAYALSLRRALKRVSDKVWRDPDRITHEAARDVLKIVDRAISIKPTRRTPRRANK